MPNLEDRARFVKHNLTVYLKAWLQPFNAATERDSLSQFLTGYNRAIFGTEAKSQHHNEVLNYCFMNSVIQSQLFSVPWLHLERPDFGCDDSCFVFFAMILEKLCRLLESRLFDKLVWFSVKCRMSCRDCVRWTSGSKVKMRRLSWSCTSRTGALINFAVTYGTGATSWPRRRVNSAGTKTRWSGSRSNLVTINEPFKVFLGFWSFFYFKNTDMKKQLSVHMSQRSSASTISTSFDVTQPCDLNVNPHYQLLQHKWIVFDYLSNEQRHFWICSTKRLFNHDPGLLLIKLKVAYVLYFFLFVHFDWTAIIMFFFFILTLSRML